MPSNYQATQPQLFGNVGSNIAPKQPIDIAGAAQALTEGAGSLIRQTMLRKQAEFERQHQMNQEAIERQRWDQQAGWHAAQAKVESDRWAAQNAQAIKKQHQDFILGGGVEGTPAVAATPDTTQTIAPETPPARLSMNMPTMAPGQFSSTGPPPNPIISAIAKGSVKGAPQVSAPAMAPTYTPTAAPTPAPAVLRVKGKPAVAATPDHYDPEYDAKLQRTVAGNTINANSRTTSAQIRADATTESAQIRADHAARFGKGEQPTMIGGNPYYSRKDEKGNVLRNEQGQPILDPAVTADGKPIDVSTIPQKPMTPAQQATATGKQLGTMDQQLKQYERALGGAKADLDAAKAKYDPTKTDAKGMAAHRNFNAAQAAFAEAQAKYDSMSTAREKAAAAQQAGAAPPTIPGVAPTAPTTPPAAPTGFTDDEVAAAKAAGAKTPDDARQWILSQRTIATMKKP